MGLGISKKEFRMMAVLLSGAFFGRAECNAYDASAAHHHGRHER